MRATVAYLSARYDWKPVIPVADVCRDFFDGLSTDKFLRKAGTGEIPLPVIRMEASQKTAKGVHVEDLADFLDARRAAAKKELEALNR